MHEGLSLTYQLVYTLNFLACVFVMKLMSWALVSKRFRLQRVSFIDFLFKSPFISIRSFDVSTRQSNALNVLKLLFYLALSFFVLGFAKVYLVPLTYVETLFVASVVYFLTEVLGTVGQLLFFWSPLPSYPMHNSPLNSRSLSKFWGCDWNGWVQDWLRDLSQGFRGHGRQYKMVMTFLISGLFHEVMCNLPYWLVYGKSYFGTMMLYFLLQALGLGVDKKFLRHSDPLLRRIWLWVVVLLPSPLFVNKPLLHFLGLA